MPLLHRLLPFFAILGAVLSLGLGTSLAKQLFPVVGSLGTSALRVGFSALWLWLLWRPWRKEVRHNMKPGDGLSVLRYGACLGLMNLFFYQAIQTIPFGIAVAIEFSGPLAVAVWTARRWQTWIWIVLAVLGLAILLPWPRQGSTIGALDLSGVLYAMAAATCWAAYILFGKRLSHMHAGHSVALGLGVAAMVVVPIGAYHAGAALLQPWVLAWGLLIAAVSSAIPISLEMLALKRLPTSAFGVMASLEPAVAALLGWLVLHETLTPTQSIAIACIMLAAIGVTLSKESALQI